MDDERYEKIFRRIHAIDVLRGIAILIMLWVHFTLWFSTHALLEGPINTILHGFLTHAGPVSAPFFIFVSGMSVTLASIKRRNKGMEEKKIRNHVIKRGLLVILLGYAFSFMRIFWYIPRPGGLERLINFFFFWDLLHALGLLMILGYYCSRLSIRNRIIILIGIIIGTTILCYLPLFFGQPSNNTLHLLWIAGDYYINMELYSWTYLINGNLVMVIVNFFTQITWYGAYPILPYFFFTLFGSIVISSLLDAVKKRKPKGMWKYFHLINHPMIALGSVLGIITLILFPGKVDPAFYCILTAGGAFLLFFIVFNMMDYHQNHSRVFNNARIIGTLPLTLYMLHGFIIGIILEGINTLIPIKQVFVFPLVLIPILVFFIGLVALAYTWNKYNNKYSLDWILSKIA